MAKKPATKKVSGKIVANERVADAGVELQTPGVPQWRKGEVGDTEEELDPKEEKFLDLILKAVVVFILGWLGLSILLVLAGLFGLMK